MMGAVTGFRPALNPTDLVPWYIGAMVHLCNSTLVAFVHWYIGGSGNWTVMATPPSDRLPHSDCR